MANRVVSCMTNLGRKGILFEDSLLLVADKPAGLLTIATEAERERTLYALLRAELNTRKPKERLFIVHRLDREASGLLVFAKDPQTKEFLQAQFKDHSAGRTYVAIVEGRVIPDSFTIQSNLAENSAHRVYVTRGGAAGKPAITHVRVLRRRSKTTLVEVRLETGRKHQIRVHLADRGHPIVGDKTYGSVSNPLRRMALHGWRLEFRHPGGRPMRFESAYPGSFDSL
jgi:23S rRNA pseudouridine1911/1915/1917 synthase